MGENESSDEDYMSDAFLAKCSDKRPGLVPERVARLHRKEAEHRVKNQLHRQQNVPHKVLESEHREEGLKNAISSENRGFRLLEKMGYKPGTAIGKTGTGKLEPIAIEVKADRFGLGEKTERKRKEADVRAMRSMMAQKRQKRETEWRQTICTKFADRETEKDLAQSQNVCEQLDSENGVEAPSRLFFWPAKLLPQRDEEDEDEEEEVDEEEEAMNAEDQLLSIPEKLAMLTDYLRTTYHYCTWCGTRFDDEDDLATNCPGDTADDH